MYNLTELLQHGSSNAWLFVPTAILLGALHGLEPGHSKTMMAAFIVAIRGSVKQAVLLGLCATFSHTLIVWIIALGGMYLWQGLAPETIEPYLQVVSAVIIVGMGVWMIRRARHDQHLAAIGAHDHDHERHDTQSPRIDTGHGVLQVSIFEDGVPPRFRVEGERGAVWSAQDVKVETQRGDGTREIFSFLDRNGFLESLEEIPEPHEFMALVSLTHDGHTHDYAVAFVEHDHNHHSAHDHVSEELHGLEVATGYQDAHELAHANDIRRRFADRQVTTGQIMVFGLTGGLIPCPGAITVLLLCLQLKKITLGAALVLCFSIGLALTMVMSGVIAAISVKQMSKRFSGFGDIVRKAPYVSGIVILLMGLYLGINGWVHLPHRI